MKRNILLGLVLIALIAFALLGTNYVKNTNLQLDIERVELRDASAEAKLLQLKYDEILEQLDTELNSKKQNQKEIKKLESELEKVRQEKEYFEKRAQAKADARKNNVVYAASGSKDQWLAASGIPASDWGYVDYIISHESGWNPDAVNASSGACGLAQQLPCGKWPNTWNDPVGALKDAHTYAVDRYGSWAGAYHHWAVNHWW